MQLLHCEGYCLYRPALTKELTLAAKEKGALVSMDLASFEVGWSFLPRSIPFFHPFFRPFFAPLGLPSHKLSLAFA